MANLSEDTRADQVVMYLKVRKNRWVDGPEISNEKVGGSEGLRRLREKRDGLAAEGLKVERRKHPDPARDIWQYRLTDAPSAGPDRGGAAVPSDSNPAAPSKEPLKYTRPPTRLAFGEAIPCPACDGKGRRIDPGTRKLGPCTRCNGFGIVPVPPHVY